MHAHGRYPLFKVRSIDHNVRQCDGVDKRPESLFVSEDLQDMCKPERGTIQHIKYAQSAAEILIFSPPSRQNMIDHYINNTLKPNTQEKLQLELRYDFKREAGTARTHSHAHTFKRTNMHTCARMHICGPAHVHTCTRVHSWRARASAQAHACSHAGVVEAIQLRDRVMAQASSKLYDAEI